jgi:hypothetical protein
VGNSAAQPVKPTGFVFDGGSFLENHCAAEWPEYAAAATAAIF